MYTLDKYPQYESGVTSVAVMMFQMSQNFFACLIGLENAFHRI
jgi:hypothetical protein